MPEQPTTVIHETKGSGGVGLLAFIGGGLVVLVAVIAFLMFTGRTETPAVPDSVDINVTVPEVPAPSVPDAPSPAPSN